MRLGCESCGAVVEVAANHRTATCAYCASPHVLERPAAPDRPTPSFVLGFVVNRDRALELARGWKRDQGLWAPRTFNAAPVEEVRGIYLPAYLYSAEAHATYQANIGEDYEKTVVKSDGIERQTRTEWCALAGRWSSYLDEIVVTASAGLGNHELEAVEPFELGALHRFTPKLVSGWIAEDPSMDRAACVALAREEARALVSTSLAAFMPGDRHKGLDANIRFEREAGELTLLPVWVLPVRYHPKKPPARMVVNGQTGRVTGEVPRSWAKIALVVLVALASIGGLVLWAQLEGVL